jgi:hypothetical protein
MKSKTRRIIMAVAVIGVLAAGGAAFTASNINSTTDVAGYNSVSVTGATISDQQNILSSDGTEIVSVLLTFPSSEAANTVTAGFGDNAAGLGACTDTNSGTDTIYSCATPNVLAGGATLHELTTAASHFAVAVVNQ